MNRVADIKLPSGPAETSDIAAAVTAEMDRIDALVQALLRHREGRVVTQKGRDALATAQKRVSAARAAGVFADLNALSGDLDPDLALNILMVVAYTLVRPSKAHVLQTLIGPGSTETVLTQGVLHEVLMPDDLYEARLARALAPTSPLLVNGLVRAEGEGPARQLRPGFALARFVSGGEGNLTPPDAVRLVFEPGQSLRPLYLEDRVTRRLDEIHALVGLLGQGGQAMAGPAVLFAGGPGTGKSLAVHHMAARLNRPLYQIDLGRLVSKWQGETERNLTRVFDELCGTSGCILMDEADSLLGRRVEVKDSRDAQNNLTVSHLLSLLERHRGPVFMTTNLRGNLDDAYTRRLSAVVEFHPPQRGLRGIIWENALRQATPTLPKNDLRYLAELATPAVMSAAEIVNAATMAAALAQLAQQACGPTEVARAIMLEMSKSEMTFSHDDLGPLAEFWPQDAAL